MKTMFKKNGKRVLSAALCLLMAVMSLPLSAFAWTSEEGRSCTSSFGDYYVGLDGEYYRSQATMHTLVYNDDGSTYVKSYSSGNAKRKYLMTDNSGTHQVYCVESGIDFNTGNTYTSKSGQNSSYFKNLPTDAQFGVMMALMYGWHEGKSSPVAGTNADDYAYATQSIIWEYQQQLRTSPADLHSANGIPADMYYSSIKGRPAEKCYNWILSQMADHYTIPSFAARNQSKANTYTLKYNPDTQKYSLTIEDTNNTLSNIKFSASGISVSRSGNKYTFTSDKMITSPVTVSAQKQVNLNTDDMLIWGCVGKQTMISGASDPVYFYFKIDTETYGTGHIKKTSEDGVVSGIKFNISGNGVNKTVTTKADGTVDIQLMPGIYTVAEQSIDRYEPQSVQRVTIVSGHTSTVTFNNTLKRGDLEIIKNSEDNLVEGVKFHLYGTSLSGLPVDEYAVTDAKGVAKFSNVLISGDTPYVVEEIDTAVRYVVPASQTAPIEWEKVTSRTFVNVLKKFNVTVTKSDVETGTEQGDASLAGAVYVIYKGEELIDTYTTDGNGQFTSKYYICGDDWTVRELTPSEGYLLDPTIHKVGAEPELYTVEYNSTANDVTEQVIKGNIAIIKHTDDGKTQIETPEVGATFEVYLKSAGSFENAKETERDVLTCDENGFAQTKDMPYGIYTVHQTSGWEGRELMKDFDVFISADGQTYRYLINNANFESYIKIVKKDAETGNTIPYAGAGFQIYDPNGNLVTMTFTYPEVTTIDTFYTTEDGYLITPQTLEYGTGYSLVEVQAPYGYVLNSEPVYFDVAQDNSTEESGITVIEVVRSNMAQKGTITVSKSGEVFSSVSENNGLYQPIFAVSGLEGAVYEITAAEDIYTLDGTLRTSKGEVVDTVTTGADGTAKSKELYLGKYEVKEITAPFGMVLNDEIHSVELVYAGQNVAVTKTATSFYNERQRVEIDLTKSFQDWIWKDPERRNRLARSYNDTFNSVRPREYDGSHITFGGISPEITLRPHQVNAIAHILYGGNTLLAHKVGAGKTFEMVAAAQESKRLGLCQKSMFVVPNHLVGQWASEYLRLYPSANILVARKQDFETANRKKFCGRIATGDYDAVIIGHSQFEKIPMSLERQYNMLQEQLDDIERGIDDIQKSHGEQFTVKQLMKTRKSIQAKLDRLNDTKRKDSVIDFEELGVDRLFIDESAICLQVESYMNILLKLILRRVIWRSI